MSSVSSTKPHRGHFATRLGIILATAGSSVGLGNIWRFPVEAGQNGGAAFILVYLACVLLFGIPMMTAEFILGRRTHTDIASAYKQLQPTSHSFFHHHFPFLNFHLAGYAGILCVTLIFSYYSVVAGWVLHYALQALTGQLSAVTDTASAFITFSSSTWKPLFCTMAIILLTYVIIRRGIQRGIERFSKLLMPLLLILLLLLAIGSLTMPGAAAGVRFLLQPDFSRLTPAVVLSALGQAFFSLSIAIGCLSTYASYFRSNVPLVRTAACVVGIDTAVAILSGFIIFPAVFSVSDVAPDAGPGLVFVTLPAIFNSLFSGLPLLAWLFSVMFYLLLVLAALTSTLSMHEEVTAFFVDHYRLSRQRAAAIVTAIVVVLGILCCLSFGPLANLHFQFSSFRFHFSFFDFFNDVTALYIMPLCGIVLSIFVGWRLPLRLQVEELTNHGTLHLPRPLLRTILFLIRWVAPSAILLIFLLTQ